MNRAITWFLTILLVLAVIGLFTRREGFDSQTNYNKVIYSGLANTAITSL